MKTPLSCFIIMPFHHDRAVVADTIKEVVARHENGVALRSDDTRDPGNIMDQVESAIAGVDFCIADVSGANANVLWEAGYAHALGKPVIQINDTSHASTSLPFNIRGLRTVPYALSELQEACKTKGETDFHRELAETVSAVISELKQSPRILGEPYNELRNLAFALDQQSLYEKTHVPLLPLLLKAMDDDAKMFLERPWKAKEAKRLMDALNRVGGRQTTEAFWWLIVHGVFVYDQIGFFQIAGKNGWRENLDLVELSERGVALLNSLKEPL